MPLSQDLTLSTPRLVLRCVHIEDVEMIWSATRYEGFNDGLAWPAPKHRKELIASTARCVTAWSQEDDYHFTIVEKKSQCPIGQVGFRRRGPTENWNLGYWVHPQFCQQGYATEAAQAVIDFGFEHLAVSTIVTSHATWNLASQKIIEKLGFEFVRENDCGFVKKYLPVPEKEYRLTKPKQKDRNQAA